MTRALLIAALLIVATAARARAECRLRPALYTSGWLWTGWHHARFAEGMQPRPGEPFVYGPATSDDVAAGFRVALGAQLGVCVTDDSDGWRARIGVESDSGFWRGVDPSQGFEAQLDAPLSDGDWRLGGRIAYRAQAWSRPIADQHVVMIGARAIWGPLVGGIDVFRGASARDLVTGIAPTDVGVLAVLGVDWPLELGGRRR